MLSIPRKREAMVTLSGTFYRYMKRNFVHQKKLIFQTEADTSNKEALVSNENQRTNEFDVSVTGNTFSYDRLDPDRMVVKIKGNKHRAWVYYPTMHDAERMEIDADALQKVF